MSTVEALLTVAVVPTRADLASMRFISKRSISQNGRPSTSISVMSKKASPWPELGPQPHVAEEPLRHAVEQTQPAVDDGHIEIGVWIEIQG